MKPKLLLLFFCLSLVSSTVAQTPDVLDFTVVDCPYTLPAGVDVTCGQLTVPENRDDPNNSRQIQIAFAILHSSSDNPQPDPIVYLSGGPGGYTLQTLENFTNLRPLYRDRNLIVVDQRGVGFSQPALDCPEITAFEEANQASTITSEDFETGYQSAVADCRDRLSDAGIDLSAYHTDANAADIEDLRLALDYEQWNLLGTSYGTALAQTLLRDYPDGIRSVILDSPLTLDSAWVIDSVALADAAFNRLYNACEDCDDLEGTLTRLATQLNEEPASITVDFFGTPFDIVLDGNELLQNVYRALYFPQAIPQLPQEIYSAADGDYQRIGIYEVYDIFEPSGYSLGMNFSVLCADVVDRPLPPTTSGLIEQAFTPQTYLSQCEVWDVPSRPNRAPLESSAVPALLLVGEFDPVAPRTTAERVANVFDTAYLYEFPGLSHLVSSSATCPVQIMADFLDEPLTEPDTACIARLPNVRFELP